MMKVICPIRLFIPTSCVGLNAELNWLSSCVDVFRIFIENLVGVCLFL